VKDINLLPEEERPKVTSTPAPKLDIKVSEKTIISIVIVAVIAIGIMFVPNVFIKIQESRYNSMQNKLTSSKYTELNRVNAQFNNLSGQLLSKQEVINSIDKQSPKFTEIITALEQAAPEGSFYTEINFDANKMKIALKIEDTMQAAEFFANIKRISFMSLSFDSKSIELDKNGILNVSFDMVEKGAK